jgi:mannose-6-phosphate isomerase-like protein (cupin superfamily)
MHANVFDFSQLLAGLTDRYHEILRVSSLSVGIYVLDGGAMDHQKPHSEDEVYYVASGRAKMMIGSDGDTSTFDVGPGTIIFAPARVHHSFYDITERLAVLVFFAPAESLSPAASIPPSRLPHL